MRKILILAITLSCLYFTSFGQLQENKVDSVGHKQGEWIEYRVLPSEIIINDLYPTVRNGESVYVIYDRKIFGEKSEVITCIGTYINGQREGLWKEFYSNDTLKSEIEYQNGVPLGECKIFWKNGILKMQCEFGNTNNTHIVVYDTDGSLIADTVGSKNKIIKSIYED